MLERITNDRSRLGNSAEGKNGLSCGIIDMRYEDPDAAVSYLTEFARARDAHGRPEFSFRGTQILPGIEGVLLDAVSKHPADDSQPGFTDGVIYVFPANEQSGEDSLSGGREVAPVLGLWVGESLGPEVVRRMVNMCMIDEQDQAAGPMAS